MTLDEPKTMPFGTLQEAWDKEMTYEPELDLKITPDGAEETQVHFFNKALQKAPVFLPSINHTQAE